jgi:hypothetical protein
MEIHARAPLVAGDGLSAIGAAVALQVPAAIPTDTSLLEGLRRLCHGNPAAPRRVVSSEA